MFASVEDHALLFGEGDADAVLGWLGAAGVAEGVVKLLEPACLVVAAGVSERVDAGSVVGVVDTTAAGDSFAAGYIAARRAGLGAADAARAGHRLAGVVVQHRGAIIGREFMP